MRFSPIKQTGRRWFHLWLLPCLLGLACLQAGARPLAPAPGQPEGVLNGRIIYTSAGHGWTCYSNGWFLQRTNICDMNEDYGNLDQMTLFAWRCFNAGATVVPMRPIGHQTNEVVLDNTSPAVTFTGDWQDATNAPVHYGPAGGVGFRWATVAATETAAAAYTPTLPQTGFYPVYTWVPHGANRTNQLYRIRHTGGEALVRVPHHMVGNGWVYLGTYYFLTGSNAATGTVLISNEQPVPDPATVVVADALRFGNGMGSIDRGLGLSGYPREEECARYWVQNSLGQGQPSSLYDGAGDDGSDNVGAPPRLAAEMNREQSGNMYKRIYLGFHSNAASGGGTNTSARGNLALHNTPYAGAATSNQQTYAYTIALAVNTNLSSLTVPPFELTWLNNRSGLTYSAGFAYGEINAAAINNEMDATILEVAFHDNPEDSKLMRDPKFRDRVARASCQAIIRHLNQFDGLPMLYPPDPPSNIRAQANTGGVRVSWTAATAGPGVGAPTGYRVYLSPDGYGFGQPVTVNGSQMLSVLVTNVPADTLRFFRVASFNAAGESMPSEVVGCRITSHPLLPRVLFVNGYTRFDRTLNLRQPLVPQQYLPPGATGVIDRVMPRLANAFDYVVPHALAVSAYGLPLDSCHRDALGSGMVSLANYAIVLWGAGQELTNALNSSMQTRLESFLRDGGHLFISGSDLAWSLGRTNGTQSWDRLFFTNQLHAALPDLTHHQAQSWAFAGAPGSIFQGLTHGSFDDGARGIYRVQAPDVLTPNDPATRPALLYAGGNGGAAALQHDGSGGRGRVVYLGFPFETIPDPETRQSLLRDTLRFFLPPRCRTWAAQPDRTLRLTFGGPLGERYVIERTGRLDQPWTPVSTNTVNDDGRIVLDESLDLGTQFFYRTRRVDP